MPDPIPDRHGGQILVDALRIQGVRRVFCIPGESYLAALDGLYQSGIDTIVCRHEGGAAMMAEAQGKLTGRPGIAMVTRGPGATNAAAGVHVAMQDSTPMILFVGQVARDQRDREAFQEVDYRAMFGALAKWVAEVDRTDRLPEYISRAFHVAQSGRPGPVVLALPEDMLAARATVADVPAAVLPSGKAAEDDIAAILDALIGAQRPMVIAGGGGHWDDAARDALGQLADRLGLPVGAAFRRHDVLDNRHPCYAGDVGLGINPALADRIRVADVLLALGPRLGEITTNGYTLLKVPQPAQSLIHIHPDPSEPGTVYRPALSVIGQAGAVVQQLAAAAQTRPASPREAVRTARASCEAWQIPQPTPGAVRMERVIAHLNDALPPDAIVTNGAGNYAAWLHRYFRGHALTRQLAPTNGSMGYGLPAAIAAKLQHPGRTVICLAGDGCFQMTQAEFATACQFGANVVVLVCNNGHYGTIRMHQQRHYPGRPSGTAMVNPDFAAWARSYGAFGATVNEDAQFPDALARAIDAGTPAILDLRIDPRALSPRLTSQD